MTCISMVPDEGVYSFHIVCFQSMCFDGGVVVPVSGGVNGVCQWMGSGTLVLDEGMSCDWWLRSCRLPTEIILKAEFVEPSRCPACSPASTAMLTL